jgi:hypothetical protein
MKIPMMGKGFIVLIRAAEAEGVFFYYAESSETSSF